MTEKPELCLHSATGDKEHLCICQLIWRISQNTTFDRCKR